MSKKVFKQLRQYNHILVTGPQRSGTTIAAAMISQSLGRLFVPDEGIGQDNIKRLEAMIGKSKFVLQCPALFPYIHTFDFESTAIVVMFRRMDAILRSMKRIGWAGAEEEIKRYKQIELFHRFIWQRLVDMRRSQTEAIVFYKYQVFREYQIENMQLRWYGLDYTELDWHPLWLPMSDRAKFEPRQISLKHTNAQQERI